MKNVKPEDRDPRLPYVDPNGQDNEQIKPQAQLDDTPLYYNTPETIEQQTTTGETPHELRHDENEGDADNVEPAIGDTSQQRLRDDENGEQNKDLLLPNNSNFKLDNTGLNMKPDIQPVLSELDNEEGTSKPISLTDYEKEATKIENPLEKEGDLPEEGMLVKPSDVQQNQTEDSFSTGLDMDGTSPTQGDNIDQGVDTEDIDPNILHYDPENGRNYTDLTDEQGNEVS